MSPQDCRDREEQCELLAKFFERDDQLHETWRVFTSSFLWSMTSSVLISVLLSKASVEQGAAVTPSSRQGTATLPVASNCPAGATFSQPRLKKSVER